VKCVPLKEMSDYPSQLQTVFNEVNSKQNLAQHFCKFVEAIQTLPPELSSPESQTQVKELFQDVNTAVEQYNRQFQNLMNELGILCREPTGKQSLFHQFFSSFTDLLRLAYTVYQEDPEKLSKFQPVLQRFLQLLETNQMTLQKEEPLTNALLLQLVNSAWALTNTRQTMESAAKQAKQQGGRKTRKQRRH
jgi:DNA repair ATPase RecN